MSRDPEPCLLDRGGRLLTALLVTWMGASTALLGVLL